MGSLPRIVLLTLQTLDLKCKFLLACSTGFQSYHYVILLEHLLEPVNNKIFITAAKNLEM
jgi:transposase